MSSVGVLIEKSRSIFVRGKKNLSVRRKIFKVWRGGGMFKCRISGVRKKNERRISGKKIKVFLGEILKCEILLSSYSLVGLYVNLQVLEKKIKSGIFIYWVRTHCLGVML